MNEKQVREFLRLYPQLRDRIEFVPGSWRNRGYWRIKPTYYTINDRRRIPVPLARTWLRFTTAAYHSYGDRGLKPVTTKEGQVIEMPPACRAVQRVCKGFVAKPFNPEEMAEKIRKTMMAIAQVVTRSRRA